MRTIPTAITIVKRTVKTPPAVFASSETMDRLKIILFCTNSANAARRFDGAGSEAADERPKHAGEECPAYQFPSIRLKPHVGFFQPTSTRLR